MKELSIEEKAKRYDEAINKAKDMLNYKEVRQEDIEYLFPELKESEDESIRKALIDYFRWNPNSQLLNEFTNREVFAWLEKQGEHAYFINKIQIGDKVTRNEDGVLVNLSQLNRVAKKDEKQGEQKPIDPDTLIQQRVNALADIIAEQKPADKVEHQFKVGDSIKTTNEGPLTITKITDSGYWSEDLFICDFDDAAKWELVEQKPTETVKWSPQEESCICQLESLVKEQWRQAEREYIIV